MSKDGLMTFPDLLHVEKIAEALWRKSPIGNAALMVGAGLSRNARNTAAPNRTMPTWGDLSNKLCDSLYPSTDKSVSRQRKNALEKANATSGALRLAQEFEASFGRTELNRLLKTFVPDEEFAPSHLHADLLKLPWADVFTTNWDTLLERSADAIIDRRYDVIRTRDDIPASQQPRIIKLHGSFPSNYPLIFTEEDYRKYPVQFAYFVNMVQQSLMENLFCLVGFSGDDPNFLHWSGWVRDNLGSAAPKIYLVGWLDLAPVQRRVLEERGVIPVDLAKLPQRADWPEDCQHRYSLEWFLWMLKLKHQYSKKADAAYQDRFKLDPPSHLGIDMSEFLIEKQERLYLSKISGKGSEAERLEEIRHQVSIWREDRQNYEGWIIAPPQIRNKYWASMQNWTTSVASIIQCMPPWERLFTLREVAWQMDVCLVPLNENLIDSISQVLIGVDLQKRACFSEGKEVVWDDADWSEARSAWSEIAG